MGASEFEEWDFWLGHASVDLGDLSEGRTFNQSQLAIAEAVNGHDGRVAMGRGALVHDEIGSERLVDVVGTAVPSVASYVFITPPGAGDSVRDVEASLHREA